MKKFLLIFLALLMTVSVLSLTACKKEADVFTPDSYQKENGRITVGLDDTFAPMGFRDEKGELIGFDIDLAKAVADLLGVEIKFQPIDWNSKELELDSGRIDCIWNGMSASEERQKIMQLTNMYLNNRMVIMVAEGVTVDSVEDLADLKIGAQDGSYAVEVMEAHEAYDTFKDNLSTYPTYDEVIMALSSGRIDCMVIDEVFGEYKNSKLEKPYEVAEFNFGDDKYAIGCKKGNTELVNKLNNAIKTLIDNGKAAEISEKWFGKDMLIFEDYE